MERGMIGLVRNTLCVAVAFLCSGALWAQSSPSDYTYATRYDAMRRVTGTIAPDPDGAGPLHFSAVRNTYDIYGNLIRVETGELAAWQSEAVKPKDWSGFTVFKKVESKFDNKGRKTREDVLAEPSGTPVTYAIKQFAYDPVDRLTCAAVRMNLDAPASLPDDACALSTPGSNGPDRITKNVYDAAGQLIQVRKAVGTPLEQAYATYTYTPNGKQEYVIDANGNRAKFEYDGFDRQSKWIFPSTTAPAAFNGSTVPLALSTAGVINGADYEQYGYDAAGNRTSFRRRDGRTFAFTYDALNRVTSKTVPDGGCTGGYTCSAPPASATRDVFYGYDLQGHELYARYDSASGADGITNAYDGLGRLASATVSIGGVSRALSYQWDADNNRTRVTHPDGAYFAYAFDGLDRFYHADWWTSATGTVPFAQITYDAQGRRSTINRASSYTDYGYDGVSRLTSQVQRFAGGAGNATTTLGYNPASQIVGETRDNDDYAFRGYVNVNRGYAVNGLNQYASVAGTGFSYDSNGNLTSDGTRSYTYDAENRLIGVGSASLSYDPNGRLYSVTTGAGTTSFLYDGDQLAAEYNGAGGITRRFMFAGQDEPLLEDAGGALNCSGTRVLHTDHQGSIVALADCSGNRTGVNSYDEYGIPGIGNAGRFQYTGQAWLPEVGLYYYKARIYSPTLGRFLQTDPIGYRDQVNLYAYVANDPVNKTDPDGKEACCYGPDGYHLPEMEAPSLETLGNAIFAAAVIFDIANSPVSPGPDASIAGAAARTALRGEGAAGTGAGKAFTQAQKREIYAANRARNGGELRSDQSGMRLTPSQKSMKGVPTPKDAAQVDHHIPRSRGGTNDISNGRVLSAPENRAKSNTMPQPPPSSSSVPQPPTRPDRWWWPF